MDCVEVCPVDCFYEGENMLVIHPDECIDCSVCVPECPVDAIKPDTDPGLEEWWSLNAKYAKIWPNIKVKKAPPADSKEWEGRSKKASLVAIAKVVCGRPSWTFLDWAPGRPSAAKRLPKMRHDGSRRM